VNKHTKHGPATRSSNYQPYYTSKPADLCKKISPRNMDLWLSMLPPGFKQVLDWQRVMPESLYRTAIVGVALASPISASSARRT
jgi:hypothetical protein